VQVGPGEAGADRDTRASGTATAVRVAPQVPEAGAQRPARQEAGAQPPVARGREAPERKQWEEQTVPGRPPVAQVLAPVRWVGLQGRTRRAEEEPRVFAWA
jgi:hypothetical protein